MTLTKEKEKKMEIFEDLVFSELRAGKLLQTNSHALDLYEKDPKRGRRVVPHVTFLFY